MAVFMEIVDFLKPKFVLMENVVDILKFAEGFLGRFAFSKLVKMNYQSRLGIMAAGCYGVPQFRMRVFLWGAQSSEVFFFVISFLLFFYFRSVYLMLLFPGFTTISPTYT